MHERLVDVVRGIDHEIEQREEVVVGDLLELARFAGGHVLDVLRAAGDGGDGLAGERVEDLAAAVVKAGQFAEELELERALEGGLGGGAGARGAEGARAEGVGDVFTVTGDHLALGVGVAGGAAVLSDGLRCGARKQGNKREQREDRTERAG